MKKLLLALFAIAGITSAHAQVTGNLGLATDYRFRGISQTQNGPAIQGGVDYTHSSGLYIGNWNSSVSSQLYTNGAGVESDLYAGYKKDIYKGLTIDVGSYNYFYPNATNGKNPNFNTQELYAGLGYGPVALKYSRSTSNYFGVNNSAGTQYYQADVKQSFAPVSAKLKDLSFVAHYGRTAVANHGNASYNDINVGAVYTLPKAWDIGVRYYTNTSMTTQNQRASTVNGQQLYKDAWVATLTKTFE
jgi:uncharacterized protein (TIGR02001 family)